MDKNSVLNKIKKYRDSNLYTERFYVENLRRMGGEKRLEITFGLYEMALNLCKSSILESNPSITDFELKQKLFERFGYDSTGYPNQRGQ
ncbi:hypothetical protein HKBW3S42_00466 [Candidatus Hakubella thermalkaliphila]|uniref:Uncharacterized protein n=3 Tax=Candidatus Hakubella thermalkaliphila TaxID=2754717 RepID=A0A6V8NGU8_9ACTN|nr:hypothetical protein [Candidatus Hakubella thermalkaliphila]MBT9170681.1 hypothetical protein [Actinomycetota bacterium]GFP19475.1 hypothetical protein HKBW3S03_00980 [Candidatus Hakubella thermalkaliphila]GFP29596.1 hypothetical protein HKBW3S34_00516 [Candidatus Hakubella thermalkaliphila]GFP32161.1 hypothetical protein HKBW3S42_00466 [Candidatus Hakubella thermalkaliphila]GFP42140.1 hypothetical protein HKBW3C_01266 [Candidatus Hakubella thermalkaliphila]